MYIPKDYEGYMGNYGPTVDHWYYRACLVIWPRSRALQIALNGGVESAVRLGRRCLKELVTYDVILTFFLVLDYLSHITFPRCIFVNPTVDALSTS